MRKFPLAVTAAITSLLLVGQAGPASADSPTLKEVKARGTLNCGVSAGLIGFSSPDDKDTWDGFDVDFCRAVAAAIFNEPDKVNFVPLNAEERFKALKDGKIDLLSRNSTWAMSRETEYGITFAGISYYDGQGFMVRRSRKVESALELGGASVCVQSGTTTQLNLADYFRANNMTFQEVAFPDAAASIKAYGTGKCDVFTSDVSQLYAERLKLDKPDDHVILADVISKEPLGPVVRQGDDGWLMIVKWSYFAMLNAEELGVSSKNIDQALTSAKPDVRRLVGVDGGYGEKIGLTNDWAARIVRLVGNYAEVYDRNVGVNSRLGIPRGLNQLWSNGGIQYAPPIR
jgi:general L-amino acid transport system substrate-binding protein